MNKKRYFPLALQALVELMPEIEAAEKYTLIKSPTIDDVLEEFDSLPEGALLLGMAADSLPVLLNLHDPLPGSILITGDEHKMNLDFLKTIAAVSIRTFDPNALQYCVLSSTPEEWQGFDRFEHCATILPIYEKSAMDFIESLYIWAHSSKSGQIVILIIDGLEKIQSWDKSVIDNLRWLTMRGPARRVWPIASISPNEISKSELILSEFRTTVFGKLHGLPERQKFPKPAQNILDELNNDNEFLMKEGDGWLKFWIPRLDGEF